MSPRFNYSTLQTENSFRVFLKNQDTYNVPLHYHPNYEMNFVIKGNGTRFVGDNIEDFEEGDLILLAPNIPHRWKSVFKKNQSYSSLVIQWGNNFLSHAWSSTPGLENINRLLELSGKGIKFDKYFGKEIKDKQDALLLQSPFEKLMIFLQLLNDLAQTSEFKMLNDEVSTYRNHIQNARIETIFNFIKEKYSEKITLAKIAALVNMSEGAFSRFFSQTTKKPFFSFLNEYRIKMACHFLINTDMHADEIGRACGYDCLQFFYRQFQKYKHCSPQTFRKKFLADW